MGGTPFQQRSNQQLHFDDLPQALQVVESKRIYHPFADQPSPFEQWRQTVLLALETVFQFVLWDVLGSLVAWTGKTIGSVFFLTPLLVLGVLAEYCRRCKNKVSAHVFLVAQVMRQAGQNPFRRSKSRQSLFEAPLAGQKGDLVIVLDLDLTLVYSSFEKAGANSEGECVVVKVRNS